MTTKTRFRVFSLLLLLGLMAGILLAPPATENAYAGPCCSSCDSRELACLRGIIYPECGGNSSCCFSKVANCWRYCTFGC